jgi:hypothetical protein
MHGDAPTCISQTIPPVHSGITRHLESVPQLDHDDTAVLLEARLDVLRPPGIDISGVEEVGYSKREIKTVEKVEATQCTSPSKRVDLEVEIGYEEWVCPGSGHGTSS